MLRILALPVTLLATAMVALAGEDPLPVDEPDSFDIEPPLLKQNLSDEPLPGEAGQNADVSRLEKQLERVKRNAAGAERLCKMGVLSKTEVEQRLLKVVRCECDLANARLVRAKEEVAAQEAKVSADELDAAKSALAQLTEAAQAAAAKRERAELETAEANLRRQEKLLKLGSAHKSDVDRAQEKLAELKAQKN
jgi:multidrug resistance efflux pump